MRWLPTRDYLCNYVVSHLPWRDLRMNTYRSLGVKIGKESTILMSCEMRFAWNIVIGQQCVINRNCYLDGLGGIIIGDQVNISSHTLLITGSHDPKSKDLAGYTLPINIEDYSWLCTRSTILAGVTVGKGAVVAAGSVVTKSVEPFTIVAGVPARKIGERPHDLNYVPSHNVSWE